MRIQRSLVLAGLGLLALGLAGCQSTAKHSSASFKDSQSSTKTYHAAKPDAAVTASSSSKIAQTYQPRAAQTQAKGYVKSGKLQQKGQYTFDKVGTKLTLTRVHALNRTIKSGQLTYRVTSVRLIENVAENDQAKRMAAQALNLAEIKSPYYTLQIKFTILNRGKRAVTTDGIKAIQLGNHQQLTAANQLSDASAGKTIPAHRQLATFATGLAGQETQPTFTHVKLAFAGGYDQRQHQLVKPSGWLTVDLS